MRNYLLVLYLDTLTHSRRAAPGHAAYKPRVWRHHVSNELTSSPPVDSDCFAIIVNFNVKDPQPPKELEYKMLSARAIYQGLMRIYVSSAGSCSKLFGSVG